MKDLRVVALQVGAHKHYRRAGFCFAVGVPQTVSVDAAQEAELRAASSRLSVDEVAVEPKKAARTS